MKLYVAATVAAAAFMADSGATAEQPWKQMGVIGQRHFVVVERADAHNAELLGRAASSVCPGKQTCFVTFWSDAASVPRAMPMTRVQQQAVVAQYLRNPVTGKADLLLRCKNGNARNATCLH